MNLGLDALIEKKPPPTEQEQYMFFFLERGISFREFASLPIPYIIRMVETAAYNREQQEKQQK
jgi:hypothetical protein